MSFYIQFPFFRVYIANILLLLLLTVSQVTCWRTDYKVINL